MLSQIWSTLASDRRGRIIRLRLDEFVPTGYVKVDDGRTNQVIAFLYCGNLSSPVCGHRAYRVSWLGCLLEGAQGAALGVDPGCLTPAPYCVHW